MVSLPKQGDGATGVGLRGEYGVPISSNNVSTDDQTVQDTTTYSFHGKLLADRYIGELPGLVTPPDLRLRPNTATKRTLKTSIGSSSVHYSPLGHLSSLMDGLTQSLPDICAWLGEAIFYLTKQKGLA